MGEGRKKFSYFMDGPLRVCERGLWEIRFVLHIHSDIFLKAFEKEFGVVCILKNCGFSFCVLWDDRRFFVLIAKFAFCDFFLSERLRRSPATICI